MENIHKPHSPIKLWAEDDRPREKMLLNGAASLSSAELLAILINNGTKNKSAIDLAQELLTVNNNSLNQLSRMSIDELQVIKGIGPAKAITIKAALELATKKETETVLKLKITSAKDVLKFLQSKLSAENREHFLIVYLNIGGRIITHQILSSGGITGTVVDIRLIIKKTLEVQASSIILCHNHPSGNFAPSKADKDITQKIKAAAELFDIKVLDHIIVSDEGHFSFADNGLI